MSNNLIAISNAINDSGPKPQLQAPPPQPAPPKITAAKKKEEVRQEEKVEQKSRETERSELYSKITHYFHSKHLAKFIPDDIKPPKSTDSLESLQAIDKTIKGFMHRASKEIFVQRALESFINFGETGLVEILKLEHWRGISDEILRDPDVLQPELEELAIELSDNYVPGPKIRLAVKIANIAQEFLKHGPKNKPSSSSSHYEA